MVFSEALSETRLYKHLRCRYKARRGRLFSIGTGEGTSPEKYVGDGEMTTLEHWEQMEER